MRAITRISNYINNPSLQFNYINNSIYIMNYEKINHFDDQKIVITGQLIKIIIYGKDLVLSKLLDTELMIRGNFERIEFN